MQAEQITAALISEVNHRLYDECMRRIQLCLEKLTDDQVWWRPNEESNSIGNLLLHLNGNVRQWILSGLGDVSNDRQRQLEFDTRDALPKEELWRILSHTMEELKPVISGVNPKDLMRKRPVQTFEETGLTILVHVTEHFSYHTGQIAWITKMLTSKQLGFYENVKLE